MPQESLYWSHSIILIKLTGLISRICIPLKIHFIHFSGDICKIAVWKISKNSQNHVFRMATFQLFELSNVLLITILKTGITAQVSCKLPTNSLKRTNNCLSPISFIKYVIARITKILIQIKLMVIIGSVFICRKFVVKQFWSS